jgi:ABC-type uncharacterized transport system involved in gliding motility auxiliary subunit
MKEQLKKADVFGLVLIASAIISYLIRKNWTVYQWIVLIAGAVLIVIALILKSNEIRAGMGRRSTKFGINSGVSILILLGLLGLVNYLADRHQTRFDTTTERLYSLGDESVKVLAGLQQDIRIKAFYPGGNEPEVQSLLDLYASQNRRITVEFIDPDKNPQAAQQYQVTMYEQVTNPMTRREQKFGTIILDAGESKVERIEKQRAAPNEEDVTNALMKLTKGETKTVLFVQGHGEKAIDSQDRAGYQVADGALTRDGYKVSKISLVSDEIPATASVVVIAGPVTEPFPEEMNKVDTYLNAGGSVLLMLDPPPAASLNVFTEKWSVTVGNNRVIDNTGMGQLLGTGPGTPLVMDYRPHPVVDRFNLATFFPLVRSVSPSKTPVAGLTAEPLLETASRSWGESDLTSNTVKFDEKSDVQGPVAIATVVTKDIAEGKKARMIVIGDSDFAINANFSNQGNGNFFVNAVKWLARDENLISIKTKDPTDRPITMTESGASAVGIIVVFLLPGAALGAGALVWWKRRG